MSTSLKPVSWVVARGSYYLGEEHPSVIGRGTLRVNLNRHFQVETGTEASPVNKYTGSGWLARANSDQYIFPRGNDFFVLTGFDIEHRNGGIWVKDAYGLTIGVGRRVRGAGLGYSGDNYVGINGETTYSIWYRGAFKEVGGINHRKWLGISLRKDTFRGDRKLGLRLDGRAVLVVSDTTNHPEIPRGPGYFINFTAGFVYRN
jgi:hypothetical protein